MSGAAEDLSRVVCGLRRAAEADLAGNAYYRAVHGIDRLIELIKPADIGGAAGKDTPAGFAAMLAEARISVESNLAGNSYYMAANSLADLASLLPKTGFKADSMRAAPHPKETFMPSLQASATNAVSFERLAAASKARMEESAAKLGLVVARHTGPVRTVSGAGIAGVELEKRSSEPCFMTGVEPRAAEVAPPAAKADLSWGSPPLHSKSGGDQSTKHSGVPNPAPSSFAPLPSTPEHEVTGVAHAQAMETEKRETAVKPKGQKSAFAHLLDLVFGHRD